jgi:hypothetical protein
MEMRRYEIQNKSLLSWIIVGLNWRGDSGQSGVVDGPSKFTYRASQDGTWLSRMVFV